MASGLDSLESKLVLSHKTKCWNKVSLYEYECCSFAKEDAEGISLMEKVMTEVWPTRSRIIGAQMQQTVPSKNVATQTDRTGPDSRQRGGVFAESCVSPHPAEPRIPSRCRRSIQ